MFMPTLYYDGDVVGLYMNDSQKLHCQDGDFKKYDGAIDSGIIPLTGSVATLLFGSNGWIIDPFFLEKNPTLKVEFKNDMETIVIHNSKKSKLDNNKFSYDWTLDIFLKYKNESFERRMELERNYMFEANYVQGKIEFIEE